MEDDLHYFTPARAISRLPTTPSALGPSNPLSYLEHFLPQLLLFGVFFIVVGVLLCRALRADSDDPGGRRAKERATQGLDPARVASFPVVLFDAAAWGAVEEEEMGPNCAVCLADFCGGDAVRVLPVCGHGFHSDCINPWFAGHTTCPLCRCDLAELPAEGSGGLGHVIDITVEE